MRFTMTRTMTLLAALLAAASTLAHAVEPPDAAIRALLAQQQRDWNAGNLEAFATGYKHSSDILFIGKTVRHGYQEMLNGYRKSYSSREAMGTLTFSGLQVQPLDEHFATTTGRFHLARTQAGGGDAAGYFLLVLELTPQGWKIVRDDTTASPVAPATKPAPATQ